MSKKVDDNAEYVFYVHDYTNRNNKDSNELSESKATVKLFGKEDKLLNIFNVPLNREGNKWEVFRIRNGNIITIDSVAN